MLLNILDLGRNTFERWSRIGIENRNQTIHPEDENDDKATNKQKDTSSSSANTKQNKAHKQKLQQWLRDLLKVPSHYCSSSSKKMYIESVLDRLYMFIRCTNIFVKRIRLHLYHAPYLEKY